MSRRVGMNVKDQGEVCKPAPRSGHSGAGASPSQAIPKWHMIQVPEARQPAMGLSLSLWMVTFGVKSAVARLGDICCPPDSPHTHTRPVAEAPESVAFLSVIAGSFGARLG